MKWPWLLSWSVVCLDFLMASPTRLAARLAQSSVSLVSSGNSAPYNQANQIVGSSTAIGLLLSLVRNVIKQTDRSRRPTLRRLPLPLAYFGWLIVILLLSYCTLTQLVKGFYIRRFHEWL